MIQIKDAGSNTFIRNLFPLGSAWEPRSLRAIADIGGNGMQEVAVLARRKSDDIVVVQALDVSGVGSVNMFVP